MEIVLALSIVAVVTGLALIVNSFLRPRAPRLPAFDDHDTTSPDRQRVTPSWLEDVVEVVSANDLRGVEIQWAEIHRRRLLDVLHAAMRQPVGDMTYGGRTVSVLLHGPRGCGKSLLAQAVALEVADVVVRVSAFDLMRPQEVVSPQQLLAAILRHVRLCAPSVLIIDDLQHLFTGTSRSSSTSGVGFDLLQEIRRQDRQAASVIVGIATTASHEAPAIVRLRRDFDHPVAVGRPDHRARACLLEIVAADRMVPVDEVQRLAELTHDLASADVIEAAERACNRAILVDGPSARLTPDELTLALQLPTEPKWIDDLDLSHSVRPMVDALFTQLLDPATAIGVLITGQQGVGRKTVIRCLARSSARNVVTIPSLGEGDDWGVLGTRTLARIEEAIERRPSMILFDVGEQLGPDLTRQQVHSVAQAIDRALEVPGVCVVAVAPHGDAVHQELRSVTRFDGELFIPRLDQSARVALLRRHLRTVVVADVSIELLATEFAGSTAGDLADYARRVIRYAKRRDPAARRRGITFVTARDLWEARLPPTDTAA